MNRLNIGCGSDPTPDWTNYDNSPSVWLAKHPLIAKVLSLFGLLDEMQKEFIEFAKKEKIGCADASKYLPEIDNSVGVVYSSHMLEHMDKEDREGFLDEAHRVLFPGGIIRLAVPNISFHIDRYVDDKDANRFMESTLLTKERPRTLRQKIRYILTGDRHHQWMYDGESLCKLLSTAGFEQAQVMQEGESQIPEPGQLNLRERAPESVFVEARKAA